MGLKIEIRHVSEVVLWLLSAFPTTLPFYKIFYDMSWC
jgi:hypothetical protein